MKAVTEDKYVVVVWFSYELTAKECTDVITLNSTKLKIARGPSFTNLVVSCNITFKCNLVVMLSYIIRHCTQKKKSEVHSSYMITASY